MTHSLTNKQREQLYDAEVRKAVAAGRGEFPVCALCDLPIAPGQKWHDNHDKYLPRAIGGKRDGISHALCNTRHNNEIDTPLVAKVKRVRQKHIGAWRPYRPMLGSRDSQIKKPFRGPPIDRRTGEPWGRS